MVIRLSKNDVWFRIKQPKVGDVDHADRYFGVSGEFSERSDNAFKKHLKRYADLNAMPMYKAMNGERIKNLLTQEGAWY